MLALRTLTPAQKTQLRNAFTLIDGDSRDSKITKEDLVHLHQSLGLATPSNKELEQMLAIGSNGEVTFNLFLSTIAEEVQKFGDVTAIYEAVKVLAENTNSSDIVVEVDQLKDACCSVQLGGIGSGDHRLERARFEKLVEGFVREQNDGKKVFMASKWINAYIE